MSLQCTWCSGKQNAVESLGTNVPLCSELLSTRLGGSALAGDLCMALCYYVETYLQPCQLGLVCLQAFSKTDGGQLT